MDAAFSTMAARSDVSPARWRRPFLNWMDGVETGWAIPQLLIGFVAVWLAFLMIAYIGGDLHSDVLETWTLGRSFEWGYSKHPPLMGWVARVWTLVFPLANWSFQLMALTNAAIGLWAIDLISRRFTSGDKRIVVLLLLMLLPVYQLHAQRFNANAVLLSTWPIATYCFLRSFETREIRWAVAAGVTAALAMLGKYYSVFLIVSFLIAAVCHPQRRGYFASFAPGVSTLVMVAALGPHIHWLATTGAKPFVYALARHTGRAFGPSLIEAFFFILAMTAILAIPVAIWALMTGNRSQQLSRDIQAMNPGLLLLSLVGAGTIVLPAVTSVVLGSDMPPLWGLQGLFLVVIPMVCGESAPVQRFYSVNLAAVVIGSAIAAVVVVAPLHAYYRNSHPLHEGRNFYSLAAEQLTRQWQAQSSAPLAAVGGDDGLAFAVAFYSADHPRYDERLVVPEAATASGQVSSVQGWAALCYDSDTACIAAIDNAAARAAARPVKTVFDVQSTLLGQPGATQRFTALIVPPAGEDTIAPLPQQQPESPGVAEPAPGVAAALVRQDEPTCCAQRPAPDSAELALRPTLPRDPKHTRHVPPPAAAADSVNWPDQAAAPVAPVARDGFARWPIPTPGCAARGGGSGCAAAPLPHARPPIVSRGAGATATAFWGCTGLRSHRSGHETVDAYSPPPLSVLLKRKVCAMAGDFDNDMRIAREKQERWRLSQERSGTFFGATREISDRKPQPRRKDGVPEPQRRPI